MIQFSCPKCYSRLTASPTQAGAIITCPGCQFLIDVPAGASTVSPKQSKPAPTAFRFRCPSCKTFNELPEKTPGLKVTCRFCGQHILVPGTSPNPTVLLSDTEEHIRPPAPKEEPKPEPPPSKEETGVTTEGIKVVLSPAGSPPAGSPEEAPAQGGSEARRRFSPLWVVVTLMVAAGFTLLLVTLVTVFSNRPRDEEKTQVITFDFESMQVGQVGRFPTGERLRVFQVLDNDSFLAMQGSNGRVYQFNFPAHGLADGSPVPFGRIYKVKETQTYLTKGGYEKTIFVLSPDPDAEAAEAARRAEQRRQDHERAEREAKEKEEAEAREAERRAREAKRLERQRREDQKRAKREAARKAAREARLAREQKEREAREEREAKEKADRERAEEAKRIAREKKERAEREKARQARLKKEAEERKAKREAALKKTRERAGYSLLSLAKRFKEEGDIWEYKVRLRLLVKKYPETKAAAEARKLLGKK
jgi:hypothetical protein